MSWDVVIFAISLFAFILSMIATLGSFFSQRWKWFVITLACVLVSGTCLLTELYKLAMPAPDGELPVVVRSPTSPL